VQVLTLRGRTAFIAVLAALALPARALDFGEIEVLSAIGEKLDARIPLKAGSGEWFHVTCLALSRAAGSPALPPLADGIVSVERRSASANLRVRTATPVHEPAVAFGVTSTCAGEPRAASREFSVLLDPPRVARSPEARKGTPLAPADRPAGPRPATQVAQAAPTRTAEPRVAEPVTHTTPARAVAPAATPALAPTTSRPRGGSDFVLRLSSDPIDVSRSRAFDEKSRAVLRERLRLLDNDDQVAAMLALRDNMQRLEARVAELQLKLASAPPVIARAEPRPAPAAVAAPAAAPTSPSATPRVDAAPKVETAPKIEAAPRVETPPKVAPAPKAEPAPAPPAAAKATPPTQPPAARMPVSQAVDDDVLPGGIWPWIAALALLLAAAGAWLWKRRASTRDDRPLAVEPETVFMQSPLALDVEPPIEIAAPVRAQPDTPPPPPPAAAAPEDPVEALRRRYIEERFPEIRNRTIVLDDPASVVKGARLFYEDGALPRAVELLRFATEDRPDAIRPWLALFEIYRLERLTGEYADLAGRFAARHGANEKWEKVRAFGREIDPGNSAYADSPAQALGTIGPREARRLAQAHADPIAENWLDAPMDFENEVLATELRRALMARAAVEERDLVANPMPALRSVEMFSVG